MADVFSPMPSKAVKLHQIYFLMAIITGWFFAHLIVTLAAPKLLWSRKCQNKILPFRSTFRNVGYAQVTPVRKNAIKRVPCELAR